MKWSIKPVFEMICRFVIATAVLFSIFAITEIVLKTKFDTFYYLGFMIMLAIWSALPSADLFKFQRPERYVRSKTEMEKLEK